MPGGHLIDPPLPSSTAEPVWKDGVAWPHVTDISTPVRVFEERANSIAVSESRVIIAGIGWIWIVNGRVYDRNIVLALCMKTTQESRSFIVPESHCVIVEVSILVHVIDVCPDVLEWYISSRIIVHDLLQYRPVCITPSALMIAKGEVLLHCRHPYRAHLIVLRDLCLCRPCEEIQIDATAKKPPGDVCRPKKDILAMAVAVVYSMRIGDVVS